MLFIRRLFVAKLLAVALAAGSSLNQEIATNSIAGAHIRILAYHEPPIFYIIRNPGNQSSVRFIGFPKDVFDILSASWNFTYSFVEVTPSMVKSKGSVDAAMLDQLLLKNADFNGRLSTPTAELLTHIDYTVAVSVFTFAIIQPMPQIQNGFSAPIKPFQPTVWCLIFVAFITTGLFLSAITKATGSNGRLRVESNTRIVLDNIWYPWIVLMTQGGYLLSNRLPLRFVAGSWCLMAVVLVYAYNSTFISYISLSKYESVVNTFDDLAASKTLRIITQRGSLSAEIILNSKTGALKTLGDSLRQNPGDLILSLPGETEKILLSGSCAYVEVKRLGELLVYKSMAEHGGKCKLTFGKELDYSQVWSFGVVKNLLHLSKINKGLQTMRETGIFSQITRQYLKPIDKCLAREAYRPKKSQLTLYDVTGSFAVLGLGGCLSLLAFLLELLISSRRFFSLKKSPAAPEPSLFKV